MESQTLTAAKAVVTDIKDKFFLWKNNGNSDYARYAGKFQDNDLQLSLNGTSATVFNKAHQYNTSLQIKESGLYPFFRVVENSEGTVVFIEGKPVLMFGSNSYLGLTHHPEIKKAANRATEKYGTGCSGSRFLNGTNRLHEELEESLADLVNKEAVLLYSTGFQANAGAISAMVNEDEHIILDKSDHSSIYFGAKASGAKIHRFAHRNMESLEKRLRSLEGNKLIVVDGVFSMEGHIIQLPEVLKLAEKYNAGVIVDDAHAVGVIGYNGAGTSDYFNTTKYVGMIVGTFSKSLAALGGFVASDKSVIEYLKHNSHPLIFSASPTPASTAAALAALKLMRKEPWRIGKLWKNTERMKNGLLEIGYTLGDSDTPILPVYVGDMNQTFLLTKRLMEEGVFVNPVVPPAVSPSQTMIRLSLMATHSYRQIDQALNKMYDVGKELHIIK